MKRVVGVIAVGLAVIACSGGKTRSSGTGGAGGATGGKGGSGGAGGSTGGSGGGGTGGYGAIGGTGGYGGSGGGGGSGGASFEECEKLEELYKIALEQAKACNPLISAQLCTQVGSSNIVCGCPTYVNPQNTQPIVEMSELEEKWNAGACNQHFACPDVECAVLQGSACVPDATGASGSCQDYWPD